MRRVWLVVAAAALSACGEDSATSGLGSSLPPPEPARFAKPGPAAAADEPALQRPRAAFATVVQDAAAGRQASRLFDGAAERRDGPAYAVSYPQSGGGSPLSGTPVVQRAGMAIDTDGPVSGYDRRVHRDPYRQLQTSLRYADGGSLDPTKIPYVVVPCSQKALLGDIAVVEYRGRKAAAVVGDCGRRWGEGSVALAERLGIPADGVSGGVSSGVTYTVYKGSGAGRPSRAGLVTQLAQAQASLPAEPLVSVASL